MVFRTFRGWGWGWGMTPDPPKVLMILMDNLHAGGHSDWGTLSPNTPACNSDLVYQDKFTCIEL